ncbi:tRNA modification GTPase MnmE [wastewater metagenome]|uniref:tRNA modification GTPase MnmE n=2 Tax=unclassified sequences TaxID=12908 RepID=A0A5B8RCF1_9ZZZZ|nr:MULTISPECIES: tRNA uridine-5-carboxymethylaminomethyl(34) synthesis GTPase MnmE [Arhodomonas]MCS4504955.1 tRNA uridine-5-carboxymethylaminomethyl(34) synthesis GTPase MnmE [Arhodomonas aquaeolei]QEA05082.1 tRNA modification GTPase MnmE [uncultured organism]
MTAATETICAVATPPGHGGIGIVRVSGPAVPHLAEAVLGRLPAPRHARLGVFRDAAGEVLDEGIALYFPAPNSFTGEDVLELQGHGGPVVLERVVRALCALGARRAEPGEFSRRAYLNDRMDLTRAEAIADLINARTEAGAGAAMRSLSGAFAGRVDELVEGVTGLRAYVEAAIDFADEEIDFLDDPALSRRLAALRDTLAATLTEARRGRTLNEGLAVAIVGRPNAGKSSLLNRLAGSDAAIVTDIPGTTRDVLRERVSIDGLPLQIMDTAGLRDSDDPVEQEGVRRARRAVSEAEHVLLVVDDREGITEAERALAGELTAGTALTIIRNKIDLSGAVPGVEPAGELGPEVRLSARTGAGMDVLATHLHAAAGHDAAPASAFAARARHVDALERADAALAAAAEQLDAHAAGELVAEELRAVQEALGGITGRVSSEALLGRIFATFCIGK